MIIAVVGAGGKTTLIKKLAKQYREQGKKVFVTTSTHMFRETDTLLSDEPEMILRRLEETGYVMAGVQEQGKIRALSAKTYEKVCEKADVVLIEADGARHMPLKFPSKEEPVIYDNVDEILVVCGLHALGCPARDVVHRLSRAAEHTSLTEDAKITPFHIQELIRKGYLEPLRRRYPEKKLSVCPNHDGSSFHRRVASCLMKDRDIPEEDVSLLGETERKEEEEKAKVGCIVMASGISARFGSNKLLAAFRGKTLIERALEVTDSPVFAKRVVLTRTREVAELCHRKGIPVILHARETRNEAIGLGMEAMREMDGCLFCPCDQPLLKKSSVLNLVFAFWGGGSGIYRLAFRERVGTPILFAREFFEELSCLPERRGGSYVAGRHPHRVYPVEAIAEKELKDVDTPEALEELESEE